LRHVQWECGGAASRPLKHSVGPFTEPRPGEVLQEPDHADDRYQDRGGDDQLRAPPYMAAAPLPDPRWAEVRVAGARAPTVPVLSGESSAGFSLHRGLPECSGTYVRSTSVLRLPATLGDVLHELGEVASGVQVTVDP
jgi:hypothetical protein